MLLLRSMRKLAYYPILVTFFLLFATRIWEPSHLIVPPILIGFADYIESFVPLIVVIPISFLLHDNYEIELGLVCGVKTSTLMFSKFLPVFLYTLLPTYLMVALYQYQPFTAVDQYRCPVPIYVPENYRMCLFISTFITILFFTTLYLFLRVVTRNCYVPVTAGVFCYMVCSSLNASIKEGTQDIRLSFLNPLMSTTILGDELPNMYAARGLDRMENLWTCNRLFFLALAVLLMAVTYWLLRKETLHENFGE